MEPGELEYKKNWEQSARRLEAWWDREVLDRAIIQVTAPREGVTRRKIPAPPTVEERWTNVGYVIESAQERLRTTYYGGDAFPMYFANLGPDVFAGYLGCDIIFGEDTSWSVPAIGDWSSAPELKFDRENRWWKLTEEMTRAAVEVGAGRFLVGLTDIHGGLDAIAALRDPQVLALDLIEHPAEVKQAVADLIPVWFEVYEANRQLINPLIPGTTSWLSVWTAGRCYPVSCDFICMVSESMFREFELEDLVVETEWLDRSIYHLDGPGAARHIDTILEIPRIRAIQWVPGEKIPYVPMITWLPLLKKIQSAGRGLHLSVHSDEVEPLLAELQPEGLILSTSARTEEEADRLVRRVEELTPRRRLR